MSSLLEQAIVDAQALRDAALKNAEQMVVEKYSDQVKQAVSSLLEQEEFDFSGLPGAEEEAAMPGDTTTESDSADSEVEASDKSIMEEVPVSSDTSSDQVVELDLEALKEKIEKIEEEEGITPGPEVDRDAVAADMKDDILASPDADSLATESIEKLVEDAILEALKVDIKPNKRGWMGAPDEDFDQALEEELARREDTEVKEELEALQKKIKELQESNDRLATVNKTIVREAKNLTNDNDKLINTIGALKEKFDVVNTSNAKLLYINRTLDCGSLNERQKKKIVEAIAKAQDANEAKVIFETLQNTVESTDKKSGPKSLREAVDRRPSLLARPRGEKKTTSADIFADRMQRLAGIYKQQ
tara:strand:- start:124 stop:1203 length:1080 start_codon:yes stop_codon:yes gene_type:complete